MSAPLCSNTLKSLARGTPRFRTRPTTRSLSTVSHPYKFHIGASWAGKPKSPSELAKVQKKDFPSGSDLVAWRDQMLSRPKSFPSNDAGEDFYYVQEMRNQSGISFGVADGVGSWVDIGVDPSLFSQAFMYHAHRYSRNAWAGEPETDPTQDYEEREKLEGWEMTPIECLDLAHGGVLRERTVEAGSSTACIININASSGVLRSANLGDSGFMIVRSSAIIYTQPPQTHFFNFPRQLAKHRAENQQYVESYADFPHDADVYETKLRDGDIVLAYTDGVSDNVFYTELAQICSLVRRVGGPEDQQVQDIADRVIHYSRMCMANRKRVSPFEKSAAREGLYFRGGKVDDATVVVAMVEETV